MKKYGRGWAYAGFYLGTLTSVAGNVADVVLRPSVIGVGGRIVVGILVPVFALVGVEVFARSPWRPTWTHRLLRFLGVLPIAGVSAYVSWTHLRGFLLLAGEGADVANYGPLAVDGTMLMCAAVLVLTRPGQAGQAEVRPGLASRVANARGQIVAVANAMAKPSGQTLANDLEARPVAKVAKDGQADDLDFLAKPDVASVGHGMDPSTLARLADLPDGHIRGHFEMANEQMANIEVGHDGWPLANDLDGVAITQALAPASEAKARPATGWRGQARELMATTVRPHDEIRAHLNVSPRSWRRFMAEES